MLDPLRIYFKVEDVCTTGSQICFTLPVTTSWIGWGSWACSSGQRWTGVISKFRRAQLHRNPWPCMHLWQRGASTEKKCSKWLPFIPAAGERFTLNSRPQKLSYLKFGVVGCYVGVVVPAGGHAEEKDLLSCAVVIVKEPFCLGCVVWILSWQPVYSQSLREPQDWQQQQDCPQKPAHPSLHH